MSQTMKNNNASDKRGRPGQRQQERMMRRERRRRRIRNWTISILAVVLVLAGVTAILLYQRQVAEQEAAANRIKDQHATATANVEATATNVAATAAANAEATMIAQGMQTVTSGSPTPSAGPATPPPTNLTPVKTQSGLQYIDLKVGSGPEAKAGSTVYVQYTGWLQSDGKKFDSSYDRGGQAFKLENLGNAQVIKGWNEGLQGMKVGGTRRLIIPADLGYGPNGDSTGTIPPNATLIFDVTLVAVK
ncbi:FKBP-type peptidyl-prolyl cis-trans isomerase [Thermosporothrix hazakensis]|jgi:FKBP-type peptidyl-prolyl cis-trans isomerase|uniref:Peptidyl-prolyl cis-trans isomerase n=2 Tax=Thermosporothrix TaxID=768650 RepID=A0A326U8F3_THEHA|nr:FKBP-type peptidyl-prolyl cis-trans isomerase [Thermosporothrix hazakensis]PZW30525.1 FKBP-type peptidyl-prolyl cis-trans isomerase [Thermosporothrix hazakensis]BBH91240.1 hypothetical protein KTC_59910 [Thermosporothrix sp. COM3]GCE49386.1 hypothetical protein KTH_42550 [Thermosporothrix hazakensis]